MTSINRVSAPRPSGVPAELTRQIEGEIAGRVSRKRKILLGRIIVLGGLIVAWEIFSGKLGEPGVLIDKFYLSQPSDVGRALWQWIQNGVLLNNLAVTMQVTVIGLSLFASGRPLRSRFLPLKETFLPNLPGGPSVGVKPTWSWPLNQNGWPAGSTSPANFRVGSGTTSGTFLPPFLGK